MKIYMVSLLHRATIKKKKKEGKKLQGKNIMAPLLHRAAIITIFSTHKQENSQLQINITK